MLNAKNNAETILTEPITDSDATVTVADATALPNVPFLITIHDEIMKVVDVDGNDLTVERAQEDTVASTHDILTDDKETVVRSTFTAGMYKRLSQTEQNANDYTDAKIANIDFDTSEIEQEITDLSDDLVSHKADDATDAHNATNISVIDSNNLFTATNVEGALSELFTSVSNGKSLVGGAITDVDENVVIPTDPTFTQLANAIRQISTGRKLATGNLNVSLGVDIMVRGMDFNPKVIVLQQNSSYTHRITYVDYSEWGISNSNTRLANEITFYNSTNNRGIASHQTTWTIYNDGFNCSNWYSGSGSSSRWDWIAIG